MNLRKDTPEETAATREVGTEIGVREAIEVTGACHDGTPGVMMKIDLPEGTEIYSTAEMTAGEVAVGLEEVIVTSLQCRWGEEIERKAPVHRRKRRRPLLT